MKKETLKILLEHDTSFMFERFSLEQIKESIPILSPQQIESYILSLSNEKNFSKLLAVIDGANKNEQLERIGSLLSTDQLLAILQSISKNTLSIDKLAPLLVGVTSPIFFDALQHAQESHLETLKKEGILEPLEHHINVLFNTLDTMLQNNQKIIYQIDQTIENLNLNTLTYSDLHELENEIESLKNQYRILLRMIDKALVITWNTHRLDLIEKLSRLKERTNLQFINNDLPGISGHLQNFLYKVYDSAPHEIQDHDKAIEGLTKLSMWYLKDYWEAGLLPSIKKVEELECTSQYNEDEKLHHRQNLFNQVQANLDRLGIGTIETLKKANIFSKPMLKEFIRNAIKTHH